MKEVFIAKKLISDHTTTSRPCFVITKYKKDTLTMATVIVLTKKIKPKTIITSDKNNNLIKSFVNYPIKLTPLRKIIYTWPHYNSKENIYLTKDNLLKYYNNLSFKEKVWSLLGPIIILNEKTKLKGALKLSLKYSPFTKSDINYPKLLEY